MTLLLLGGCLQPEPVEERINTRISDNTASPSAALVRVDKVTNIRALAIIVNFSDIQASGSQAQFASMLNTNSGYTGGGNNGSVREYYRKQSNGKANLSFEVVSVKMPRPHSYYINNFNISPPWDGHQALVREVLAAVKKNYPNGFNGLSKHPQHNQIWSVSLLMAWPHGGGANFGVEQSQNVGVMNNGITVPVGLVNTTYFPVSESPKIPTLIHELGHNIFEWNDYYYHYSDGSMQNLGHYCLMGSGGNNTSPMPINPGLRLQQGWIDTVVEISKTTKTTYKVSANSTTKIFKYTNPKNAREYYLIEALRHGNYYVSIDADGWPTDQGLAIWYVHETDGPSTPHLYVKLVQADHRDDMSHPESENAQFLRGDLTDLFDNSNTFDNLGYTAFSWKDGSPTNMYLEKISAPGATMNFTSVPLAQQPIATLPGRVEAERYNLGGPNKGYKDLTPGNSGGQYRPYDGVDIEDSYDVGGGFNLAYVQAGEWVNYTVNVSASGFYDFTARLSSADVGTKKVILKVNGTSVGTFSFTDASGWQSWRNVALPRIKLNAGTHTLQLFFETAGMNVNYFSAVRSPATAEMLANGNFNNGLAQWTAQYSGTATGTWSVSGGLAKAAITNAGTKISEIQIYQRVALTAGKTYRLAFDARGETTPKKFNVVVEHHGTPFTKYHNKQYSVTVAANTSQRFTIDFKPTATDSDVRIGFQLGTYNVKDFWLDNVTLKQL